MTAKEKSQLVEILTQRRVRDRKRMLEASYDIDRMRRKVKGPDSVEIIRKFRGPI
jgi:hypothetical protein